MSNISLECRISRKWVVLVAFIMSNVGVYAFVSTTTRTGTHQKRNHIRTTADTTCNHPSLITRRQNNRTTNKPFKEYRDKKIKRNRHRNRMWPVRSNASRKQLLQQAIDTETSLLQALDDMSARLRGHRVKSDKIVRFPSVRECNAALKNFGDAGDLLQALRMFGRMRKAASLEMNYKIDRDAMDSPLSNEAETKIEGKRYSHFKNVGAVLFNVPTPTLVTYSTLMSRAVSLGKERVALRLWKLMTDSSSAAKNRYGSGTAMTIIPDVRSTNILMNAYAKLGDLSSCVDLLRQMRTGEGNDVLCKMKPNVVTYNTVIDACRRAGELGVGLDHREQMRRDGIQPDARTYTSLISAVARMQSASAKNTKGAVVFGANDPDMAFTLFDEMIADNLVPNGVTYCALIDVCGRCGRPDLALKGLRMMLKQKEANPGTLRGGNNSNEVGAWTAAIDACGKSSRVDTAIRLFHAMDKLGAKPNTVTCGCLVDCLLRCTPSRTAETLEVLRYMEVNRILPSEVMFTSLISFAGRLVEDGWRDTQENSEGIEIYTELMRNIMIMEPSSPCNKNEVKLKRISKNKSMINSSNSSTKESTLMKVFLVFQEMKAAGAEPDIGAYNALLWACSVAGDILRSQDVLLRIQSDGLDPNDASWLHMLRTAARAGRSDVAEIFWDHAISYTGRRQNDYSQWVPSVKSLKLLIAAYMQEAASSTSSTRKAKLFQKVVSVYDLKAIDKRKGLANIDTEEVHSNRKVVMMILTAAVSLDQLEKSSSHDMDYDAKRKLRHVAAGLVQLPCMTARAARSPFEENVVKTAEGWAEILNSEVSAVDFDLSYQGF